VATRVRTGDLDASHRDRIAEILRATGVFREPEVDVALELFDETFVTAPLRAGAGALPVATRAGAASTHGTDSPFPLDGYLFLGAFTPEEKLIGYACYGATPDTDRTWDLYWIAIDPSAQGAGSGTILLSEVERRLSGLHARMLVVETSSRSDYAPTRRFYAARGYGEAARVRDFYAPADDRIIFTKRFPIAPRGAE
jgi:ribosomal protein S18 acetylase RimI-like enzyme